MVFTLNLDLKKVIYTDNGFSLKSDFTKSNLHTQFLYANVKWGGLKSNVFAGQQIQHKKGMLPRLSIYTKKYIHIDRKRKIQVICTRLLNIVLKIELKQINLFYSQIQHWKDLLVTGLPILDIPTESCSVHHLISDPHS